MAGDGGGAYLWETDRELRVAYPSEKPDTRPSYPIRPCMTSIELFVFSFLSLSKISHRLQMGDCDAAATMTCSARISLLSGVAPTRAIGFCGVAPFPIRAVDTWAGRREACCRWLTSRWPCLTPLQFSTTGFVA